MRKARAASSMPFPGSSTTGAIPEAVAASCRSLVSNTRSSSAQRLRTPGRESHFGNDGVVPGSTQPPAEAAQHLVAQKPRHLPGVLIHAGRELT
jgi:hypothetical protein